MRIKTLSLGALLLTSAAAPSGSYPAHAAQAVPASRCTALAGKSFGDGVPAGSNGARSDCRASRSRWAFSRSVTMETLLSGGSANISQSRHA